ncbi:ChaN family lipoprotein [Saccharicrinis carchari]|nr:ChaN family lipoprotein [Saccharicrinis carchari]
MKITLLIFFLAFFSFLSFSYAQNSPVDYLKTHFQKPDDYLISKFKEYPYVLLGEAHAIKENLEFVHDLIPKLYDAGVYNLCMEFGAFEKQEQLDSLLTGETYNERLAKDMMFYYNVGWAYQEYYDLYKTVWEFNKTLKNGEKKFRIINLSYQYKWANFKGGVRNPENMSSVFYLGTPDKFRTSIIQKEIIDKKEKALIYMGTYHVFTHYKMPILKMNNDNFCDYHGGWVGSRLYEKFPDKVFAITFHTPLRSKAQFNPSYVSPANGEIENILHSIGTPSVGFDLKNSPLGKLRDDSFFSLCYNNFVMEDYFDGYIFLKPFKNLHGCTYDEDFFTGKTWEEIKGNFPDPDWRKSNNIEEYKEQIRQYSDIQERYKDVIQTSIPSVQHGEIIRLNNFPSKYVAPRNIDIWLPENFDSKKRYGVLYMHDGQMLFDADITWNHSEWKVDENISELNKMDKIKQVIVVGIWNTGLTRHSEYFPEKPFLKLPKNIQQNLLENSLQGKIQTDSYLKFIVHELKPYVDSKYSTYSDAKYTFITGSSMGGLISIYAISEYPEIFGGAACLSTHWPGDVNRKDDIIPNAFIEYLKNNLPDPKNHKIYFDFGTIGVDSLYEPYQQKVDKVMKIKGYTANSWETKKFPNRDHSERSWSERLQIPLKFLLKSD